MNLKQFTDPLLINEFEAVYRPSKSWRVYLSITGGDGIKLGIGHKASAVYKDQHRLV